MELNKIQKIDKLNLFKGTSSLKEWDLQNLEGFLINDSENYKYNSSFYFNEYGKTDTINIIKEFIKKNKRKGKLLYDIVKKGDISLNFTGHITCASWLGYTLDKISFISLGYRKKIKMIKISTYDDNYIILTKNVELLTNQGYKKAKDLNKKDLLVGSLGNSYNGFKKSRYKNYFIDLYGILLSIKKDIEKTEKKFIYIKDISTKHLCYLNILGINTMQSIVELDDINYLINNIDKSEIEYDDDKNKSFGKIFGNKKNFFLRKIKKIEEVEISDGYIGSMVSKLSQNYIINNIIIRK